MACWDILGSHNFHQIAIRNDRLRHFTCIYNVYTNKEEENWNLTFESLSQTRQQNELW